MEHHFHCLMANCPSWIEIISLFATLFATFITLGYWAKSRLKFCIFKDTGGDKWKVKVTNRNLLRTSVKDIQCEIAVSDSQAFIYAKTLVLEKSNTIFIKACHDQYIFKTEETITTITSNKKYQYIRTRLIAPNFIGVKKVFEKKLLISEVIENECDPLVN